MDRDALVQALDGYLDPEKMDDYGPNGLQVAGRKTIDKVVTAVTASARAIDAAVAADADALIVHHGLLWDHDGARPLTGWHGRRVRALVRADMNLIAYHLPLDVHPEIGNNARLAAALHAAPSDRFGAGDIGLVARFDEPRPAADVVRTLAGAIGRTPVHVSGGADPVRTIGVVTGAGQRFFEPAIAAGCDLFVTGEASEYVTHVARETGTHYVWAGHHATERFGVQALAEHVDSAHGIDATFVDDDNPV